MKTEYVRVGQFANATEIAKAERDKLRLENAGYTLTHSTHNILVYRKAA